MFDCHISFDSLGDLPLSSDTFERLLIDLAKFNQVVKLADNREPSIKYVYIWSMSNDFVYLGWFSDERLQ